MKSLCVYCGSSAGRSPDYIASAKLLGQSMAEHDIRLVYGGGTTGMMGAVAQGLRENGGHILGIIPEFLLPKEAPNHKDDDKTKIIVTETMHSRKHIMFEESDGFIALPGGIGTIEEIIEVMTWGQLGRHNKPMVFANLQGFWDPMIAMLKQTNQEGFLHGADKINALVIDDAAEIVPKLLSLNGHNMGGDAAIISRL